MKNFIIIIILFNSFFVCKGQEMGFADSINADIRYLNKTIIGLMHNTNGCKEHKRDSVSVYSILFVSYQTTLSSSDFAEGLFLKKISPIYYQHYKKQKHNLIKDANRILTAEAYLCDTAGNPIAKADWHAVYYCLKEGDADFYAAKHIVEIMKENDFIVNFYLSGYVECMDYIFSINSRKEVFVIDTKNYLVYPIKVFAKKYEDYIKANYSKMR